MSTHTCSALTKVQTPDKKTQVCIHMLDDHQEMETWKHYFYKIISATVCSLFSSVMDFFYKYCTQAVNSKLNNELTNFLSVYLCMCAFAHLCESIGMWLCACVSFNQIQLKLIVSFM